MYVFTKISQIQSIYQNFDTDIFQMFKSNCFTVLFQYLFNTSRCDPGGKSEFIGIFYSEFFEKPNYPLVQDSYTV